MIVRVLAALRIKEASRRGDRSWALCPFHEDKTASNFFVRWRGKRRGQWHCFACHEGGVLRELVERRLGIDTKAAIQWLRQILANEEVDRPKVTRVTVDVRTPLARSFAMPSGTIEEPLAEWVGPAREYAEERGLTAEQVARWRIGYAVDGRLACRLIFPVFAASGVPCSYMARTFVGQEPRYLYPHESEPGYDQDVIYGESAWGAERDVVIVLEGAIKALAVERAMEIDLHRPAIAAIGGSGIRAMHALKLASFGLVIDFCDQDKAGDDASKDLHAAIGRHAKIVCARLPAGLDADTVPRDEVRRVLSTWLS
jgi:DNA primase